MNGRLNTYSITLWLIGIVLTVTMNAQEAVSFSNTIGEVSYESKDHRSNVYEVVSDRKVVSSNRYQGVILAATDYYPYGSEMGGRSFSGDYKYGFQGQEKDNEVKGLSNSINYKYRIHDPRVGRFFAVDPLSSKYPYYSNYQFSGNKPIQFIELEGLEEGEANTDYQLKTDATYNKPKIPLEVAESSDEKNNSWLAKVDKWLNATGGTTLTAPDAPKTNNAGRLGEPSNETDVEFIQALGNSASKSLSRPKINLKDMKEVYETTKEGASLAEDLFDETNIIRNNKESESGSKPAIHHQKAKSVNEQLKEKQEESVNFLENLKGIEIVKNTIDEDGLYIELLSDGYHYGYIYNTKLEESFTRFDKKPTEAGMKIIISTIRIFKSKEDFIKEITPNR